MADIRNMKDYEAQIAALKNDVEERATTLRTAGGGPYDGDMEHRVTALETKLETILPTLATKGDIADARAEVAKGFSDMVKWMVGVGFTSLAVLISAMTFIAAAKKDSASSVPTSAVPPIIINVPSAPGNTTPSMR